MRSALPLIGVAMVMATPISTYAQTERSGYFGLQPGTSTRAHVDAALGTQMGQFAGGWIYAPHKDDKDGARALVEFSDATPQGIVMRISVALTQPRTALAVHQQYGLPVMSRMVAASREEFFFPSLRGAVFATAADAPATTLVYVSASYLGRAIAGEAGDVLDEKNLAAAKAEIDKALTVDPSGGAPQIMLARYLMATQKNDEAIALLETSTTWSAADQYEAHAWLGSLWGDVKKDKVRARAEFAKAVGLAPSPRKSEAHELFGRYLTRDGDATALAEFEAALRLDSSSLSARRAVADTLYDRGDYSASIAHYEHLVHELGMPASRQDSTRWFLAWRYAYALGKTGKLDRGIAVYWQLASKGGTDAATLNNIGDFELSAGRSIEARDAYRQVLASAPDARATAGLGMIDLAGGNAAQAKRQFTAALAIDPKNADVMVTMARAELAAGSAADAVTWITRAIGAGFADAKALENDAAFASLKTRKDFVAAIARIKR